jgi:hypothetical protein
VVCGKRGTLVLSAIQGQAVRNSMHVVASEADVSKLAVVHECKLFRSAAGFAPNAESSDGLIEHPCDRMWRGETANYRFRQTSPVTARRRRFLQASRIALRVMASSRTAQ